ncbi:MAG: DUF4129 domain-containing protein [Clostridia bacterium]|nr:DUF4129 domain-containing protein [Clostridia bacterium]
MPTRRPPPAPGPAAAATAATVARSVGHHLPVLAALAVALLAVLAGRAAWRETRLPRHPDSAAETLFARLERLGRRYGLPRRPAETPREYARRFAALAPGADVTAGVVVAALEVARYAPRPVTSGDLAAAVRAWERLNAQLAARAGRLRHTWRRWML